MKTISTATIATLVLICDCVNIQYQNHHTVTCWIATTSPQYFNCDINSLFPAIESFQEAMMKLPNLFRSIKQQNRHNLLISPQLQLELSKYYVLLIDKIESNELSQRQLIVLIRLIMYQNDAVGINLHISVWNQFFYTYYKLPQSQYRDSYVFKLLQCMDLNGSNCKPNIHTFCIILSGIINNQQIQHQLELFNYIINILIPQYNIQPIPQIYHLQFRLFINKGNINGISKLLMDHPTITFPNATIQIFNYVLSYLPHYVQHESIHLADSLQFLMNEIMVKTHNISSYDRNTYQILRKLYDTYPFLHDAFQKICQPFPKIQEDGKTATVCRGPFRPKHQINGGHDEVYRIMQRMKQLQLGYHTKGYINYNRFVRANLHPDETQLNTPNAADAKSKRDWDAAVRNWRRGLHKYDNYTMSETILM